jgi:hypothetical protein
MIWRNRHKIRSVAFSPTHRSFFRCLQWQMHIDLRASRGNDGMEEQAQNMISFLLTHCHVILPLSPVPIHIDLPASREEMAVRRNRHKIKLVTLSRTDTSFFCCLQWQFHIDLRANREETTVQRNRHTVRFVTFASAAISVVFCHRWISTYGLVERKY